MVFSTVIRLGMPKRIPTIKFRKGAGAGYSQDNVIAASIVGSQASGQPKSANAQTRPTIEDWQLPKRYWRKELDDKEIEYINRGGPE